MSDRRTIGVLGGGSWGTALAAQLGRLGHSVPFWVRDPDLARAIQHERVNTKYLPGIDLAPGIACTSDLAALADCRTALVVVPSHGFRPVVRNFLGLREGRPVTLVSGTKGIEGESLLRMSEVTAQEAERAGCKVGFAVLSGPSFAQEMAKGAPTAAVIASRSAATARELQQALSGLNLRLYDSPDVIGVELGGTVKNVIAIAAGLVRGLELGHNARAALITRGLHEMTRLGVACGGQPATFSGLAGLGDLVLTCTSSQSRNERVGEALARGASLEELSGPSGAVAEGVRNSRAIHDLALREGVEMPITDQMMAVLYVGKPPREALDALMARQLKSETH